MTGLLLFAAVAAWIVGAIALTTALVRRLPSNGWRPIVGTAAFVAMLVLPLIDEIIGGFQFHALCRSGAILKIDAARAKGAMVKVVIHPENESVSGTVLPMYHSHFSFRLASTNEEIGQYDSYVVKGGWFIRLLGISEGNAPLVIGRPSCSPPGRGKLDHTYGFILIN